MIKNYYVYVILYSLDHDHEYYDVLKITEECLR